jgi:hypothetical protein
VNRKQRRLCDIGEQVAVKRPPNLLGARRVDTEIARMRCNMLRWATSFIVASLLSLPTVARALTVSDPPRQFRLDIDPPNGSACRTRPQVPPDSELCANARSLDPEPARAAEGAVPEELFAGMIDHGAWQTSLVVIRASLNDREFDKEGALEYGTGLIKGIEAKLPPAAHVTGDAAPKELRVHGIQVLGNTITVDLSGGTSSSMSIFCAVTNEGIYQMVFTADQKHASEVALDAAAIVASLKAPPAEAPMNRAAFETGYAIGWFLPPCLAGIGTVIVVGYALRRRKKKT